MWGLIHLICDYGEGDLAWSEIEQALYVDLPHEFKTCRTIVGSFSTIETGLVLAQLGLAPKAIRPDKTFIFVNCAPRKDRKEPRKDNEGEGLLYGVLDTGVPILAVHSGYSLSFVRERLAELWTVDVPRSGSQFRSRDLFPPIVGLVAKGDSSFQGERLTPEQVIPEPLLGVVGYVDSFGNMKTTWRSSDPEIAKLPEGGKVEIALGNGKKAVASIVAGNFNVHEGELAFGAGSSGHDSRF